MTTKHSNISQEDYKRYLENKMTNQERNAFEKELQKEEFEAEALEGFEAVGKINMRKDLDEIQAKINGSKKNKPFRFIAAAATILLIVSAGVLWLELSKENKTLEFAQVEDAQKESILEKTPATSEAKLTEEKPLAAQPDEVVQEEIIIANNKEQIQEVLPTAEKEIEGAVAGKVVGPEIVADSSIAEPKLKQKEQIVLKNAPISLKSGKSLKLDSDTNKYQFASALEANKSKTQKIINNQVISGKVVSSDKKEPLPGVVLVEKETGKGVITDVEGNFTMELKDKNSTIVASFVGMEPNEFNPDTLNSNLIELQPDNISLDEVVTVGYARKNKKVASSSMQANYGAKENSTAKPKDGFDKYNQYLKNQAVLPADYGVDIAKVKLSLLVSEYGEITEIKNLNKSDEKLVDKAVAIVQNGPGWEPKFKNGKAVKSKVKLTLVFQKKKE